MDIIYQENNFTFAQVFAGDELWLEHLKLRTRIWNKPGWEENPASDCECDEDDDRSTHYVVTTHQNDLAGSFRFIWADSLETLPFVPYCNKKLSPCKKPVEISRWCTNPDIPSDLRKKGHAFMLWAFSTHLDTLGADRAYMDVWVNLHKHIDRVLVLNTLGEVHTRGEDGFVAAELDVPKTMEKFKQSSPLKIVCAA